MRPRSWGSSARALRWAASQWAIVRTLACSPVNSRADWGFAWKPEFPTFRSGTGLAAFVKPVTRKY